MKRETIEIDDDEFEDQTGSGPWEWQNEVYDKVTEFPNNNCDGQGTDVIVKRQSDGKFFKFTWFIGWSENYHMAREMREVFERTIVTSIYE
jgi:hypothetical protein